MAGLLLLALSASLASHLVGVALAGSSRTTASPRSAASAAAPGIGALLVLPAAAVLAFLTSRWFLKPYHLGTLDTLAVLLWVCALTPFVVRRLPQLRGDAQAARPEDTMLLAAGCAVLGAGFVRIAERSSALDAAASGFAAAAAYAVMHTLLALLDERMASADVPQALRGAPITLVAAALVALGCAGLGGLVLP
jgi:electron transport complex protein RnfA